MEIKKYSSEYCEVSYLKEKDAVLCEWLKKCSGKEYREPLKYGLELLKKFNARTWIADTTNGFENEREDSEWLVRKFIPQTVASSCQRVVFIINDKSFLKEEINTQSKVLSQYFEVLQVEQLQELK